MGHSVLRALSFDADQTLWDFREVQQRALESTIDLMVADGTVARGVMTAGDLQRVRDEVVLDHRGRPHCLEDVRRASFVRILDEHGHADPERGAQRLTDHYLDVRFSSIRLFDEVAPALARLKIRFRLGLLTNGNTHPDRCGLPNTFDAVVLGPEHGIEKPAGEAFALLADRLAVPLSGMAHIGDDRDDVDGANRAGCTSILIDRDGRRPDFAADADHVITDLDELESLLARYR